MRDIELYRHLLGLETPWTVSRVELNVKEQRVDCFADHAEGIRWPCPECGREFPLYDHSEERTWRHLDSCQFLTFLHARPPRVRCDEHGLRQVGLPWAEPHSRFTTLFERLAVDVLLETDVLGAARILRLSWDEAWHLMERAVDRRRLRKGDEVPTQIGVDEVAVARGHVYATVVSDFDEGTVEYVEKERKQESLDGFYASLSAEQRKKITAVAMDMWEPFINSTREHVPGADDKIVFDRFHIMSHLGRAVDAVRLGEHRARKQEGDLVLKGSKWLWLFAEENLPERYRERFADLKTRHLKTGRAWAIKESLRGLWSYIRRGWAEKFFRWWYFWATHSRLEPIIREARMVKRRLANILTYFTHRMTNAVAEGLNGKIQRVKRMAYGYRNFEHFRTAIFFHCGGLQLHPVTHANVG